MSITLLPALNACQVLPLKLEIFFLTFYENWVPGEEKNWADRSLVDTASSTSSTKRG